MLYEQKVKNDSKPIAYVKIYPYSKHQVSENDSISLTTCWNYYFYVECGCGQRGKMAQEANDLYKMW